MRKIYSLALMAVMLLVSANGWAQESSYPKGGDETSLEGKTYEAEVTYTPKGATKGVTRYFETLEAAFESVDGDFQTQETAWAPGATDYTVSSSFGKDNPITIKVLNKVAWEDNAANKCQLVLHDGQYITLDLNGQTVEGKENILRVRMCCANLTVTNTAETQAQYIVKSIKGASHSSGTFTLFGSRNENDADYTVLTITGNVKIDAPDYAAGILAREDVNKQRVAYGVKMNILNGAYLKSYSGIAPNGQIQTTTNNPVFTITNATIEATGESAPSEYIKIGGKDVLNEHYPNLLEGSNAIYAAGNSTWNIDGSTIKGPVGIYVKAGVLNIKNTQIYSNGTNYAKPLFYDDGTLANGVGIVFDSNASYGNMGGVKIEGNTTVKADKGYAIEEVITKGDLKLTGDDFVIKGGTFTGGTDVDGKALTTTVEMLKELQTTEKGGVQGGIFSNPDDVIDFINKGVATVTPVTKEDGSTIYVVQPDADATYIAITEVTLNNGTEFVSMDGTQYRIDATTGNKDIKQLVMFGSAELTIAAGQTLTVGGIVFNNKDAKIIVEAGGKLIVKENGVVAENVDNIVLQMNNEKQAVMLLNPASKMSYTTPKATIQLYTEVGKDEIGDYAWRRMGSPVMSVEGFEKSVNYATAIYKWDYNADSWAQINAISELQPFAGYTLTQTDASGKNPITYSFKGRTVGNSNSTLAFSALGYNYFANSYTGYATAKEMLETIMNNKAVEGSVWRFNDKEQKWDAVAEAELAMGTGEFTEIAPMQTFILRLMNGATSTVEVNYEKAIWNNRENNSHKAPAKQKSNDNTYVKIVVTSANGQSDRVGLLEDGKYSDAFDNGADATKYMNTKHINFYAETDYADQTVVASDNIEGTMLSLQTTDEVSYTMTFEYVSGKGYAIKDMQTGIVVAMEEGNSYEFVAQANSEVSGRFKIVNRQEVTTSIEETSIQPKSQGIYTILGQYVGDIDMWATLPAGVYVVDGMKVAK